MVTKDRWVRCHSAAPVYFFAAYNPEDDDDAAAVATQIRRQVTSALRPLGVGFVVVVAVPAHFTLFPPGARLRLLPSPAPAADAPAPGPGGPEDG